MFSWPTPELPLPVAAIVITFGYFCSEVNIAKGQETETFVRIQIIQSQQVRV